MKKLWKSPQVYVHEHVWSEHIWSDGCTDAYVTCIVQTVVV